MAAPIGTTDGTCRSITTTAFGREFSLAVNDASLDHGLMLWDASVALIRYLEHSPKELAALRGARVLELGAGTGLLGLALAHAVGARVVLTDLPHVCANIAANVRANSLPPGAPGSVTVLPYAWSGVADAAVLAAGGGAFDAILGTDVAYSEELNPVLLASAAAFAGAGGSRAAVLFANELRCAVAQAVFDREWPAHFAAKRVPTKHLHPEWRDKNMLFFKMKLRPRARRAVSAGVGASADADADASGSDGGGD
jgi:predicted nicotinamide N-methyase